MCVKEETTILRFKQNVEPISSSDIWYDLTMGGYIKPEKMLEEEDAENVVAAVRLVRQFLREAENLGLIEEV